MNNKHNQDLPKDPESEQPEDSQVAADDSVESNDANQPENPLGELQTQLDEARSALEKEKKEYLFLMADFDNFRKRTLKEKADLIRNGAESAMKGLLPIVDDFERGLDAIGSSTDAEAVKEGMTLIYNKFVKYLEQNGVKVMDTDGVEFNDELHEAVALVDGDSAMKGKVIDTVQKGYMINDKVLRHAKVAVGR